MGKACCNKSNSKASRPAKKIIKKSAPKKVVANKSTKVTRAPRARHRSSRTIDEECTT